MTECSEQPIIMSLSAGNAIFVPFHPFSESRGDSMRVRQTRHKVTKVTTEHNAKWAKPAYKALAEALRRS